MKPHFRSRLEEVKSRWREAQLAVEPMWLGHTTFSGWWQAGGLWLASRRMADDSPLLIRRCSWVNWRQLAAPNNAWTCSTVAAVRQHNRSAPLHILRGGEGLLILMLGKAVRLLQEQVTGISVAAATLPAHWGPQTSRDETGRQLRCEPTDWASSCGGNNLVWKPPAHSILAVRWDLLQSPLLTCLQRVKAHL